MIARRNGIAPVALAIALAACGGAKGTSYAPASCPGFAADPFVANQVVAANGTFQDHCDANGNLVEYTCDDICSGIDSHGECMPVYNGSSNAVVRQLDCKGTCAGAVCLSQCPAEREQVEVTQVTSDGSMTWMSRQSGHRWACAVHSCVYPPEQGDTLTLMGPLSPYELCAPGGPEVIRFLSQRCPAGPSGCEPCAYACAAF